jgi:hypothetical protein
MEKTPLTTEQAAAKLLDAAKELADPETRTLYVSGKPATLTAPSLLARLALQVFTGPQTRKAAMAGPNSAGSRPPLHLPSLELRDRIVAVCNRMATEIAGTSRYQADPANAVKALAYTAHRNGGEDEIRAALKVLRGFISAIRTLEEPPVLRDLDGVCGECQAGTHVTKSKDGDRRSTTALVVEVREGERSRVSCRSCNAAWTPEQTRSIAAYVTGATEEELEAKVQAEFKVTSIKRHPDAEAVLADLKAYVEEYGHLPPANSADPAERRLAQWLRTRTNPKRVPASEQGLIVRAAVIRLLEKYPSASEAKLAATEKSTMTNLQAAA